MNTIEFQASIKNGVIPIPAEYQQDLQNTGTIVVTIQKVATEKGFSHTGIISRLTKEPVIVKEFKTFYTRRSPRQKAVEDETSKKVGFSQIRIYGFTPSLNRRTVNPLLKNVLLQLNSYNTMESSLVFRPLTMVCVNARKKLGFTDSDIAALIQDFYQGCTVIESSQQLSTFAAELRGHYLFSFWDSLIVAAAIRAKVPILYSEDMQNELIVNKQLKIVNPFV